MRLISIAVVAGLLGLFLASCTGGDAAGRRPLTKIKDSGVLRVATIKSPTVYHLDREGDPTGPEADMAQAFADSLGVRVHFVVKDSVAAVLHTLQTHEADIAAAGLTVTSPRQEHYLFGPTYQQITEKVVCNRKYRQLRTPADLYNADLGVVADSSYGDHLEDLEKKYPKLHWKTIRSGTQTLLRMVWQEKLGCTVADSNIIAVNRRFYPSLLVMFPIHKPEKLAWAMPERADKLKSAVTKWLKTFRAEGELSALQDRYYSYIADFDYVDNRSLVRRIKSRLPKFLGLFRKAGRAHDIPPLLLAAQSYQESHWDPNAESPTGVRGMMMLTRSTAGSLGVKNRLDPAQSVNGGARYLEKMKRKISGDTKPIDRNFLALAAYTIGYYHLRDARKLAKRLGRNPDSWADVRAVLPLLSRKKYYTTLNYGFACGVCAVRYVGRIRNYLDVIRAHVDP